jgi:hypothetical protein
VSASLRDGFPALNQSRAQNEVFGDRLCQGPGRSAWFRWKEEKVSLEEAQTFGEEGNKPVSLTVVNPLRII